MMTQARPTSPPMRPMKQRPPRQSIGMYRTIATVFLLLTAVVVGLVAYVVLSRAEIVVMSKQEPANVDFIVDIAGSPGSGEVFGTVLQSESTLQQTFETASIVKIDAPAEGRVRITSTLYRPQVLIATTRLQTPDGDIYRLRDQVTVPANGSVEVDVYADVVGAAGNVSNTTFIIPGLSDDARRFFAAQTVSEITGGVRDQRMLTKQVVEQAVTALEAKLHASLRDELRAKAQAEGVGVTSGEFIDYEVVRKSTDVPIGEEKEQFTLTLGVRATAVFYDAEAFEARVRQQMNDRLPYGRALLNIEKETMTTDVEKVDLVAGRANLHVAAKGTTVVSPNTPALGKDKLLGITVDSAKKYLERIEGVSSASVTVRPFWMGRLPNVADHITIEVR